MEIKIIGQGIIDNRVWMFDGEDIYYELRTYNNKDEFNKIYYNSDLKWLIGIDEEGVIDNEKNTILYIEFLSSKDIPIELLIQNAVVYVTNKGQTIDKIII